MLDGRKEIAKYNKFMDEIFARMNAAIKAKNLDPMDLKLLPTSDKMPRSQQSTGAATLYDVRKVSQLMSGEKASTVQFTAAVMPQLLKIGCYFYLGVTGLLVG